MSKEKILFVKNVFLTGSSDALAIEAKVALTGYKAAELSRLYLDDVDSCFRIGDGYRYINLPSFAYGKSSNTTKNIKALYELADLITAYADALGDALEVTEAEKKAHGIALKELKAKKAKKSDKKD